MARTNEIKVRNVITTVLTSQQVVAYIDDASLWVTEEIAGKYAGLSPDRLELIERYLACAFVRLQDLALKSSSIGDVSETYQVDSTVTDYLTRAAGLDPTGAVQQAFLTRSSVQFRVGTGFGTARFGRDL